MSRTQIVAILSAVLLLVLVLEMVRRRRLKEEYSWIWLLTAIGYALVAIWPGLAVWVSRMIGSLNPASVFTFLGLLFLFLISIQFSVQISRLSEHNKDLAQHIAILDSELRRLTRDPEQDLSAGPAMTREVGPAEAAAPDKESRVDAQRTDR